MMKMAQTSSNPKIKKKNGIAIIANSTAAIPAFVLGPVFQAPLQLWSFDAGYLE